MKNLVLLFIIVVISGCSMKLTPPVQLEDNISYTINQGILKTQKAYVPQDDYLKYKQWRAYLTVKRGRYFIPNNKMIKTFYFAHHAYKIKLTGDSKIIKSYKDYFKRNGVEATICLNPIKRKDKYLVDMIFLHTDNELTNSVCSNNSSKNVLRVKVSAIKI